MFVPPKSRQKINSHRADGEENHEQDQGPARARRNAERIGIICHFGSDRVRKSEERHGTPNQADEEKARARDCFEKSHRARSLTRL